MDGDPKARLLACAMRIVSEDGIESLSLRAIARRAGVSHGAPLRHFPGRAALLSAVAAEGYRTLAAERDRAVDACGASSTAAERLHAAALAYVGFAVENRGLHELMSREDLLLPTDPLLSEVSRAFFEEAVGLVVARQEEEGWHQGVDSRLLTAALWAALQGFAHLWLIGSIARASRSTSLEDALRVALAAFDLAPKSEN
ncbi:TetR/AcrR family transcriptional regulator [Streptomyces seoulensis]|uniref:TetR/AcrR family transcriptional regulator n=1 Tax=Streptomyces seoulensis TaxID=73044 RepID=A0A4P6TU17_STRSO|nr:TetR/AcrR family transcriptional regulator [Streptomyces seoulensis]QBJ90985.1 TetR/AcrR family transcriptional regulator [Streptomyces seoulensis]